MMALFSVLLLVASVQGRDFGSSVLVKKPILTFFSLPENFSGNLYALRFVRD